MILLLERIAMRENYTIGHLYRYDSPEGKTYICDTCEDRVRPQGVKIKHKTAIPEGEYKFSMDTVSPKYSDFKRYPYAKEYGGKMPRLLNVPMFEGILIHPGNDENDTSGCILVGENKVKGRVINSQSTWKKLMVMLTEAKNRHESFTIRIVNRDKIPT